MGSNVFHAPCSGGLFMYRCILRFILLKMILPPFWDKVFHVRLLRHVLPPNYWVDFTKCWQVTFCFCLCPLNNRVCTGVHAGTLICVYWTYGLLVPRRAASRRQFSPSRICQLSALARGMQSGFQKSEMCSSVKLCKVDIVADIPLRQPYRLRFKTHVQNAWYWTLIGKCKEAFRVTLRNITKRHQPRLNKRTANGTVTKALPGYTGSDLISLALRTVRVTSHCTRHKSTRVAARATR
jgi:hypothetical protein